MQMPSLFAAFPPVRFAIVLWTTTLIVCFLAPCRNVNAESRRGFVTTTQDIRVPATANGVVSRLHMRLGDHVERGTILLQLDDSQSLLEQAVVGAEHDAATHRAASDVGVRFAAAGRRVADMDYRRALTANRTSPNAVSDADLESLRLTAEESALKVEAADKEYEGKGLEVRAAAAKRQLSMLVGGRNRISSPLDGEIAEILVQEGEWVEPGRPLMRIVGLQMVQVESLVSAKTHSPADLYGKVVTVRALLSEVVRESFPGKIVFVSPIVRPGGDYHIAVEVPNRKDRGHWILRPGMEVELHLTTPASTIGATQK